MTLSGLRHAGRCIWTLADFGWASHPAPPAWRCNLTSGLMLLDFLAQDWTPVMQDTCAFVVGERERARRPLLGPLAPVFARAVCRAPRPRSSSPPSWWWRPEGTHPAESITMHPPWRKPAPRVHGVRRRAIIAQAKSPSARCTETRPGAQRQTHIVRSRRSASGGRRGFISPSSSDSDQALSKIPMHAVTNFTGSLSKRECVGCGCASTAHDAQQIGPLRGQCRQLAREGLHTGQLPA